MAAVIREDQGGTAATFKEVVCRHQRVWVVDLETRKVRPRPCEACGKGSSAATARAS